MKKFFVLLPIFAILIGCGDEGVILDAPSTYDTVPSAPSANVVIPLSSITSIESEYENPSLLITLHATHNGNDCVATMEKWIGLSGEYTELEEGQDPKPNTYEFQWEHGSNRIDTKFYFRGGYSFGYMIIPANIFSVVEQAPSEEPVDPVIPDPVIPEDTPPPPPPPPPSQGEYVVWLEDVNGRCQSGVIHDDYAFIDYENQTITFTGQDGEVDPGDTVREYIKVETGLTYEAASARAPEILRECPL